MPEEVFRKHKEHSEIREIKKLARSHTVSEQQC